MTKLPRLFSLPPLTALLGLLTVAIQPVHGVVVYETDFDSMMPEFSLTGQDGWQDIDGTDAQGVEQYDGDTTNYAWLGYFPPDSPADPNDPLGAYLYRPLNVDPVASERPIVRFGITFLMVESTPENGIHDIFSWSFYNQAAELLGGLDLNLSDLKFYRDDTVDYADTGVGFAVETWYDLDALVDFERNTWSAYVYAYPADPMEEGTWITLFTDQPFHAGTSTLDLGEIDIVWLPNDPPGDNWILFDDYSVRILDRREAWYADIFDVREEDIAAIKDDDDDGDGLTNDAEYGFGTDPLVADAATAPFPVGTTTNGPASYLTVSFDRRTGNFLGITYEVEEAATLSDSTVWNTLSLPANEIGSTPLLGFWEVAEVRGDRRISGPGAVPGGFLRVRVVPDP